MKEHINLIRRSAFLKIRRISTIHHYLTGHAAKTLLVSPVLLRIATLSWLVSLSPLSANSRVQNCASRLVVRASPHDQVTPILRHFQWLPVRARISYKIVCLCFNTITSSTPAYLSDLLHLYSPSRSLRSNPDTRLLKTALS